MRQGNQLWNPSDDEGLHNRSVNLYYCDRRVWDLMHAGISCDIQSQYSRGGRNMCSDSVYTCMCARKGEVNVEPTEISSLHHWVNGTADMSCDFTAASWRVTLKPTHEHIAHQSEWGVLRFRCLCRGKQWQPAPPRTHTFKCTLAHLECLQWVGMGIKNGRKKSIWFHASLSRSLTDCDLSVLCTRKKTTRPQCHKTAQNRG